MGNIQFAVTELQDPVIDFVTNDAGYVVHTESGLRLDVMKCFSHQPEITGDCYSSFMWLRALQGYFILRQDFAGGEAGGWVVIRQVVPSDPGAYFFEEFHDEFPGYVAEHL